LPLIFSLLDFPLLLAFGLDHAGVGQKSQAWSQVQILLPRPFLFKQIHAFKIPKNPAEGKNATVLTSRIFHLKVYLQFLQIYRWKNSVLEFTANS
jgi:hypothetical protein